MPKFETSRLVKHSAQQMFNLVADVEQYPKFLPLCEALTIRSRRERGSMAQIIADMSVGYKAIRETFTSQVILKPDDKQIDVAYVDGPFRHLENKWTFRDNADGTSHVDFFIEYEFKSRMLGMVMGSMFDRAFRMFAEAFEERADSIYGTE